MKDYNDSVEERKKENLEADLIGGDTGNPTRRVQGKKKQQTKQRRDEK